MKKFLFMLVVMLLLPLATMAQDTPKAEVFGGYSYFRADGLGAPDENLNGWNGAATVNLNKWIGATADFSGHYGGPTMGGVKFHDNVHNFLFGPTFSYRQSGSLVPFAHVLIGASRFSQEGIGSDTGFAMAVGGGVDWKLRSNISLRVIQADYVLARIADVPGVPGSPTDNANNVRISTGIVFNFGKK